MEFYSNGKLLISGEYLVLDEALAFALPTKFGQFLKVFPINSPVLNWKSYDADGSVWYNDEIKIEDIIFNKSNDSDGKIRKTLIAILHQAHLQNSNILNSNAGFLVETELTFPRNWGLGTSSTLINNIANWFEIDAFKLLSNSFGGSGYDIACAQNNFPITYQLQNKLPVVKNVLFDVDFKEHIYFVYLNQKKDSKEAISNFRSNNKNLETRINEISQLTQQIIDSNTVEEFSELLEKHENILSTILEIPTIKSQVFPDFSGTIKSLGGWGGDFIMVVSKQNPESYFKNKGYKTILSYKEMLK